MERVYRCTNGTIVVTLPETCDREELRRVTEIFLKKVISGGMANGNSNKTGRVRKKQVLHR